MRQILFLLLILIFAGVSIMFLHQNTSAYEYENLTLDFETCIPESNLIYFGMGSFNYHIVGISYKRCVMLYGGEIENPNYDGSPAMVCIIDREMGEVSFSINDMGPDLSPIQDYCTAIPKP